MKQALTVSAPGKLFLLGEYAVLDGGPAVVAAVDRRVEVRSNPNAAPWVRLEAQDHASHIEFPAGRPPIAPPQWRVAVAAYAHAVAACPSAAALGMDLSIRSQLDDDSVKLGLGSSAAVAVAVVATVLAFAGVAHQGAAFRDTIFAIALTAHRDAQDGVGSGGDVAASTFGGTVLFEPQGGSAPRTTALTLPADASLLAAWTGSAAATPDLIRRYLAAPEPRRQEFVQASRASVDWFVAALQRDALPTAAIAAAGEALTRLATVGDLPLFTPALRRLIEIAQAHGVAAKPSGAGGGDCGIALTSVPSTATRLRAAWRHAGLVPLDLKISPDGVSIVEA